MLALSKGYFSGIFCLKCMLHYMACQGKGSMGG